MKSTKTDARACYDSLASALHCFNGGTCDENQRMAAHCFSLLVPVAARAAVLAANPSKALAADAWLMEALTVTIPARVASFRARYSF